MLARSARIIRENIASYLFLACLAVVVSTLSSFGLLGESGYIGVIFVFVYLSKNLPLVILRDVPLSAAMARHKESGGLAAGLKVVLIAAFMIGFRSYVVSNVVATYPPGAELPMFDQYVLAGLQVIVLPMIVTFLGSWIPAGIMKKEAGLLRAFVRGFMSIHTVYWRLVMALCVSSVLLFLIVFAYSITFERTPSIVAPDGGIDLWSIACWYMVSLVGLALLTYVNVVVCICYVRSEKIDLSEASQTPSMAQS